MHIIVVCKVNIQWRDCDSLHICPKPSLVYLNAVQEFLLLYSGKFLRGANFCYFRDYSASRKIFHPRNFQSVIEHALHNVENTNVLKLKRQQQLQEWFSIASCALSRTLASIPHYRDLSLVLC